MTEKTEYQRQFGWKKLQDAAKVNVEELKMDHLIDKDRKSLEFQWLSEYQKEYGSNVLAPKQSSLLFSPQREEKTVSTATMAIAPISNTGAQTSYTPLASPPISTINTASMAIPATHSDASQTNSKPGFSDSTCLAIPQSTTASAQTSPVRIAGVRFGGAYTNEYISKKTPKKIDNSTLAIAASTTSSQQTSPLKSEASPLITLHAHDLKTSDASFMAIPSSTSTTQQTSPVKKDFLSSPKAKSATLKSRGSSALPVPRPLSPVMAQYGQGNINPTIPNLHMKTFNVRAPLKEVYPNTLERGARISEFDRIELNPPFDSSNESRPTLPDPSKVLKEYIKAKDMVRQVQFQFKSEYSRQYIDWTKPWSMIKKELSEGLGEKMVLKGKDEKTAGLPSGLVPAEHPPVTRKAWGASPALVKPEKQSKDGASEPVDFTKVQSIYKDLKLHRKVQPHTSPDGLKAAEQLLARASSRASSHH